MATVENPVAEEYGMKLAIDRRFRRSVVNAINSGQQVLLTVTPESARLTRSVSQIADELEMDVVTWDCVRGLRVFSSPMKDLVVSGHHPVTQAGGSDMRDPMRALQFINEADKHHLGDTIFIFYNLYNWLDADPLLRQMVINSCDDHQYNSADACRMLYLVQPVFNEHPEHIQHVWQEVRFPLPNEEQVGNILEYMVECSRIASGRDIFVDEHIAASIQMACLGLTYRQIEDVLSECLYEFKGFPPEIVKVIRRRKAEVLSRGRAGRFISYIGDARINDAMRIVGFENAIDFIRVQAHAYLPEARKYNFALPRGILLVGPYGTGKTMLTNAVSGILEEITNRPFPGYEINVGGLFDSLVGSSEANVEYLINFLRANRGCVAKIDEMEKLLPDTSGRHSHVVDKRVSGRFLRYMSEKTEPVDSEDEIDPTYIIGTINSAPDLNAAFFRRFNRIFATDFPDSSERIKIIDVYFDRVKMSRQELQFSEDQWHEIVHITDEMSGDEIVDALENSRLTSFAKRRTHKPTFDEVMNSLQEKRRCRTSAIAAEDVARIRRFCKERAVPVGRREEQEEEPTPPPQKDRIRRLR